MPTQSYLARRAVSEFNFGSIVFCVNNDDAHGDLAHQELHLIVDNEEVFTLAEKAAKNRVNVIQSAFVADTCDNHLKCCLKLNYWRFVSHHDYYHIEKQDDY